MKGSETQITTDGVYRCCLESVGLELLDREVNVGSKAMCESCGQQFTLCLDVNYSTPVWKPDWQLPKPNPD